MRRTGPRRIRSRYQNPATLPGFRTELVPLPRSKLSGKAVPISNEFHYSLLTSSYANLRTQILEVAGFPKCIVCPSDRNVIVSSYSRFKTSTFVEGRNFNPSKNSKNCPSFS